MFKRNPGRFRCKIALLKPNKPERDELGGLKSATYSEVCTLFAMESNRSQVRTEFVGDYVTADTRYFVVRDLSTIAPDIDNSWRLTYNGTTYLINDVLTIEESYPTWVQITATAVRGGGGL